MIEIISHKNQFMCNHPVAFFFPIFACLVIRGHCLNKFKKYCAATLYILVQRLLIRIASICFFFCFGVAALRGAGVWLQRLQGLRVRLIGIGFGPLGYVLRRQLFLYASVLLCTVSSLTKMSNVSNADVQSLWVCSSRSELLHSALIDMLSFPFICFAQVVELLQAGQSYELDRTWLCLLMALDIFGLWTSLDLSDLSDPFRSFVFSYFALAVGDIRA